MKEFDKIIGYSKEKAELEQIVDIMVNKEYYDALGVKPPGGLLLYGDPGVGKTMMADCFMKACGLPVFTCRKDRPNIKFVNTIKATFAEAVKNAPAIVFLDDMDKFANNDYSHRDAEEFVAVQSCIDENKGKNIFVLATANDVRKLPSSLKRVGRFDRVMMIDAPCIKDAIGIIEHYLREKRFVSNADSNLLARIMKGRSCAQLETVVNEAGIIAGRERAKSIEMNHILKACIKTIFNTSVSDRDDDDFDDYDSDEVPESISTREKVAYHEIGHAIVSEILYPGSVTIVALTDGRKAGKGFTSCYHEDEHSIGWTKASIVTSMGGMAATEQLFGEEDLGNSRDLSAAFGEVMRLTSQNCAFGFEYKDFSYHTSEARKEKIENLSSAMVEKYFKKAKEIIAKNRDFFDKMVTELLEKDMLIERDIAEIKKTCTIVPVAVE